LIDTIEAFRARSLVLLNPDTPLQSPGDAGGSRAWVLKSRDTRWLPPANRIYGASSPRGARGAAHTARGDCPIRDDSVASATPRRGPIPQIVIPWRHHACRES